jgi:CheY-like chemotaxis protein
MPDGGTVAVATAMVHIDARDRQRAALASGQYVAVTFSDSGTGMLPEVLRRATEPFFTTKGPGTGLGLAMVHGFVQQSHGCLEIDSTPGAGTSVRMLFPVTDRATQCVHPDGSAARADASRQCVLVVEDNDDVRQLAECVLELAGYQVLAAPSGESALALLEQHPEVDLLFSDVIMPGGMNGLQLVDKVRELRPALPVLMTTGYMDDLQGTQHDRLDVLAKPYKHKDLLERVRLALQRRAPQP